MPSHGHGHAKFLHNVSFRAESGFTLQVAEGKSDFAFSEKENPLSFMTASLRPKA